MSGSGLKNDRNGSVETHEGVRNTEVGGLWGGYPQRGCGGDAAGTTTLMPDTPGGFGQAATQPRKGMWPGERNDSETPASAGQTLRRTLQRCRVRARQRHVVLNEEQMARQASA